LVGAGAFAVTFAGTTSVSVTAVFGPVVVFVIPDAAASVTFGGVAPTRGGAGSISTGIATAVVDLGGGLSAVRSARLNPSDSGLIGTPASGGFPPDALGRVVCPAVSFALWAATKSSVVMTMVMCFLFYQ
jgi:hypothetical protein